MLGEPLDQTGEDRQSDTADGGKNGGLLSFWGRKKSHTGVQINGTQHIAVGLANANAPREGLSSPTSSIRSSINASSVPLPASARASMDSSFASPSVLTPNSRPSSPAIASFESNVPTSVPLASITSSSSSLPSSTIDDAASGTPPPSAVSRFLNRFSRKPQPRASLDGKQELQLSSDDFSFLEEVEGEESGAEAGAEIDFFASGVPPLGRTSDILVQSAPLPKPLAPPPSGAPPPKLRPPPASTPVLSSIPSLAKSGFQELDFLDFTSPSAPLESSSTSATQTLDRRDDWDDFLSSPVSSPNPFPSTVVPSMLRPSTQSTLPPILPPPIPSGHATALATPIPASRPDFKLHPHQPDSLTSIQHGTPQSTPALSSSFDDFGDFDSAPVMTASSSIATSFDDSALIPSSSESPNFQSGEFQSFPSFHSSSSADRLRQSTTSSTGSLPPPTPPTKSPRHTITTGRVEPSRSAVPSVPSSPSILSSFVAASMQAHSSHQRTSSTVALVEKGRAAQGSVWPLTDSSIRSAQPASTSWPTPSTSSSDHIPTLAPPPGGLSGNVSKSRGVFDWDQDDDDVPLARTASFTSTLSQPPFTKFPLPSMSSNYTRPAAVSDNLSSKIKGPEPSQRNGGLSSSDLSFFDSL